MSPLTYYHGCFTSHLGFYFSTLRTIPPWVTRQAANNRGIVDGGFPGIDTKTLATTTRPCGIILKDPGVSDARCDGASRQSCAQPCDRWNFDQDGLSPTHCSQDRRQQCLVNLQILSVSRPDCLPRDWYLLYGTQH